MTVAELPTGNYTLLILAVVFCLMYVIFCLYAFVLDEEELKEIKVMFFQENISRSSVVYSVSLNIKERKCKTGITDLIFRLRGSSKDAPLILYRDNIGNLYKSGQMINIGIALPFSIGMPLELNVACDNPSSKAADPVVVVSDIYVRHYPRWTVTKAESDTTSYSLWKKRDSDGVFSSLATDVQVWACLDTVTNMQGAGIIGIKTPFHGQEQVLRARCIAKTFSLTKEDAALRQKASIGFRSLHYLFSLSSKWHDAWSDFSRLDHVFVLLLDQLAGIAAVSVSFAFGLEKYFGLTSFRQKFTAAYPDVVFVEINNFDAFEFFHNFTALSFFPYIPNVLHIAWVAFLCSSVIIPLSLMWCRLFREVGGKGFEMVLGNPKSLSTTELHPSTGAALTSDNGGEAVATSMILRTLECRNVHSGSCTTSNRRLRVEPMICNCVPDRNVARSAAYARSNMTDLRDESVPSGPKSLKNPKVFHESHTQSTDGPEMPNPNASRAGRYCERVVQQGPLKVFDNAVISECFEVAPTQSARIRRKLKSPDRFSKPKESKKSFSSVSLLTDEDARSVKDLVRNFAPRESPPSPSCFDQTSSFRPNPVPKSNTCALRSVKKPQMKKILPPIRRPKLPIENMVKESNLSPSSGHCSRSMRENCDADAGTSGTSSRSANLSNFKKQKETSVCIGNRCATNRPIATYNEKFDGSFELGEPIPKIFSRQSSPSFHKQFPSANEQSSKSGNATGDAPIPSCRPISAMDTFDLQQKSMDAEKARDLHSSLCCQRAFKIKKKLLAFFFLVLFQLSEIFLVSAIPGEGFNQFFVRASTRLKPVPGRMHAALLCCLLCIVLYFFITIHVIALFSLLIDHYLHAIRSTEENTKSKENEVNVTS